MNPSELDTKTSQIINNDTGSDDQCIYDESSDQRQNEEPVADPNLQFFLDTKKKEYIFEQQLTDFASKYGYIPDETVEHERESSSSTRSLGESPDMRDDEVVVGSPTTKTSLHPTELLLSEDKVMLGIEASNITCHPREPGRLSEDKVTLSKDNMQNSSPEMEELHSLKTKFENFEGRYEVTKNIMMDRFTEILISQQQIKLHLGEIKKISTETNKYSREINKSSKGSRTMLRICYPSLLVVGLAIGYFYLWRNA